MFPLHLNYREYVLFIDSCEKAILKITGTRQTLFLGAGQQGERVQQGVEVLHVPHLHHLKHACKFQNSILPKTKY